MQRIDVSNLGKAYNMTNSYLSTLFNRFSNRKSIPQSYRWVIRGISFSAESGDVIGIIGKNGAGKSTLLSMITGSVHPSEGIVEKNGKISSIIELGIGFETNFTGRQNVVLQSQLNGITKKETNKLLKDIEEFADIGLYFDKELSTYSSGMLARLAFATAIMDKPDILIIDEAISVGDISFQAKCMQRINVMKEKGTCILLVTHSINLVREFCNKALYLSENKQKAYGKVDYVCDLYEKDTTEGVHNTGNIISRPKEIKKDISELGLKTSVRAGGSLQLEIIKFNVVNNLSKKITSTDYNEKITFKAEIRANDKTKEGAAVGLLVADVNGYHLFCCNSNHYRKFLPSLSKNQIINIEWEFKWPFRQGKFRIDVGIKPDPLDNIFYDRIFTIWTLETNLKGPLVNQNFGGYLFVDAKINIY